MTNIRDEAERRRWRDISHFFREHWKQVISAVFVVTITALLFLNRDMIENLLQGREQYAYIGVFLVSAAGSATLFLPFPTALLVVNAGLVLNPLLVGVISGAGATIGELTGYLAGYSGRMVIKNTPTYDRIVGWMRRWGSWTIFVLALIPNPLFDVAGIVAGVLRYPWWKFVLIGMAGRIPKHILYAYSGVLGWDFFKPG